MLRTLLSLEEILGREKRSVDKGASLKTEAGESQVRYLVIKGWLAASKLLPDGEQQILDVILPGESYDPTSADDQTSFVQIEALCEALVVDIDAATWARLLQEHPDLQEAERLRESAAQARLAERMLRLGKSSAETRIAYALIEFCMRLTAIQSTKDGAFHIPLGQKQLGDFTGLSSVHVCRTLRRMNRQGLITTREQMDIVIHDVHALAEIAKVDLGTLRHGIIPGAA
ncbi:MAG: Crp/Fnr family transcriptional regulator [Rhodobacteraceae bacterium]|nr:Crp/Fnr family transcriptional regulator [Paracoccaceae bacterium]